MTFRPFFLLSFHHYINILNTMIHSIHTDQIIRLALAEDIGTGDMTTISIVPSGKAVEGQLKTKEAGIICGLQVAARVFALLDDSIRFMAHCDDGDTVNAGQLIAVIRGPAQGILTGERVALNFLQRLSGIATQASVYAARVRGTGAVVTDTRKTTPGMRYLEKHAVKTGGASNHRMNLADGILIKDNHIRAAGTITAAVNMAREHAPRLLKVEVEAETLDDVREALAAGADIIMLDNMDISTMTAAVRIIGGKALVEASGNMDQRDIREVALTGVDMISIGALSHSSRALDISLKFTEGGLS